MYIAPGRGQTTPGVKFVSLTVGGVVHKYAEKCYKILLR